MLATLSGADPERGGGGGGGGPVEFSSKGWGWGATTYSGQFVLQINNNSPRGPPLDLNRSMHSLIAKQEAYSYHSVTSVHIIIIMYSLCTISIFMT